MSFQRAVLASYASQGYVTLIGLVLVPVYLAYMGAENYGLVGFFLMLQGFFQLLDLGITPTICRETTRFHSGMSSASDFRRLVRWLQWIFFTLAAIAVVLFATSAEYIAEKWLTFHELDKGDVVFALKLIGGLISLRLACGLFRGIVTGFEELVWLAMFNAGVATVRFVFVVPVLAFVGASAKVFFAYQIAVSVLELCLLVWKSYRLLPSWIGLVTEPRNWGHLRAVSRFSLTIALTSAISIVVNQVDKLALSKLIPLNEFGYFTAAVLVASGIAIIAGPIGTVLQPRLASLWATGEELRLKLLYRAATQSVVLLAAPVVLLMAAFPEQLLWAWSGDRNFASNAAPTLALYAIGNGIMALGAFPFYLQFAMGTLRLHLIGSFLFAAVFVPLCVWGAIVRGPTGTGLALIAVATAYLLLWVPIIHGRFDRDLHIRWLTKDIAPIVLPPALGVALFRLLLPISADRLQLCLQLAAIAAISVLLAASGSTYAREKVCAVVRRRVEQGAK